MACVPVERVEAVLVVHGLGVAEVLDDLERRAEREHLRVRDVLDQVGEELQVAVVVERHAERVVRLLVDLVHLGAERGEPRLDLEAMPAEPVLELEVARRVRVGELVAHDEVPLRRRAVQRVAGRVRARGASSTGASASSRHRSGASHRPGR